MEQVRMLIVDDEEIIREGLKRTLAGERYAVGTCANGYAAVEMLNDRQFDLIVTDLKMPGMNGIEVLKAVNTLQPDVPVIMITGYATVETAVEAMKQGAFDYITKPFDPDEFLEKVERALERRPVHTGEIQIAREMALHHGFGRFVGESREMQKVYRRIMQVAGTTSTVLITGESGTGKELVARAIHENSVRRDRPFIAVDCSSLAETLLESELFGHMKGSFTGAVQNKTGLFKAADGGTLFLDEISNINLSTQAKLLRTLQERTITPIGGTQPVPVDIHLVAATNRELRSMVAAGTFREDLYFRLNIIPVELPPLRDRGGDIPLLIGHFLKRFTKELGKGIRRIAPDAMAFLEGYGYPGNVRELENIIERAVVLAEDDTIRKRDLELPDSVQAVAAPFADQIPKTGDELKEMKRHIREHATDDVEKAFLICALERNDWNVTRAAEETGILRPNFQGMLKRFGISVRSRLNQAD